MQQILKKAQTSSFYRWLLNRGLNRMVPFNKPHGFTIVEVEDYRLKTRLPYRKRNLNHIRGLHACALATITEFTTGFLLVSRLDPARYRLIMKRLEMEYHFQGKMDAFAEFSISEAWLEQHIYTPLGDADAVVVNCTLKIHDEKGNHLTTGNVYWQIKAWDRVKTAI